LKSALAKALAVSVFQTQVGHKNRKLHNGFHCSLSQALALLIALDIDIIALS
jgi:hypothetical protein